ncbi:hypothetical protein BRC83_07645 [Halobacteriales archaeon QS_1_68_17]|nr:MAG: hypothetical protein BRC83_07645 [Halobacteriales archaeon QS_1_68_17]
MSSSQHPVALRIEQQVGGATRLLATVMLLPLLDGIFPALVLAGALDSVVGIIEVGLLIFGGSATVAVILADMDGTRRQQVISVLGVGVVLVAVAVVEAALAPTLAGLLDLVIFERFAGLVILAVAAKTASARVGELLPRPAVIIALGLLASVDPSGAELALAADPGLMVRAGAAGLVGVGFALLVALLGPRLRTAVDIDRFRFGSAVALGVLPLGLFGLVPGDAPLALSVLGLTFLLAFDPDADGVAGRSSDDAPAAADGGSGSPSGPESEPEPESETGSDPESDPESVEDRRWPATADHEPWL